MNISLFMRDLKALFREPVNSIITLLTLGISLLFRFLIPLGIEYFPFLEPYIPSIHFLLLLLTPFMLGWVGGFLYLDELEEGVLPIFAVSPLGAHWSLISKILLSLLLGLIILPLQWILLALEFRFLGQMLILFGLLTLQGPMIIISLAVLANNRLQGLAIGKVLSLIAFIPLVELFLSPPWSGLARMVPGGWIGDLFYRLGEGWNPLIILAALLQTLFYSSILLLIKQHRSK